MSDHEFDIDDFDDASLLSESSSWMEQIKLFINRSKVNLKKWYYTGGFETGIELQQWNDIADEVLDSDIPQLYRNKRNSIWKWISLILFITCLILISLIVNNVIGGKQSFKVATENNEFGRNNMTRTLVISLDGFHPAYISAERTPFLHELYIGKQDGTISTPYMIPALPSQTFPNHWSMVTGCYPHHHGILANRFWDPNLDLQFKISDTSRNMNTFWNQSHPFWYYANEQQLDTYIHMWPGSELVFEDQLRNPTYVDEFDLNEQLEIKLQKIINVMEEQPQISVMFAYVPVVDTEGHKKGNLLDFEDPQVLKDVDRFISDIFERLKELDLNIIIVSDHGMTTIMKENVFVWEDLFGDEDIPGITKLFDDTNTLIYTESTKTEEIYQKLNPNIPDQCKLSHSIDLFSDTMNPIIKRRIPPLWILCEPGYLIVTAEKYNKLPEKFGTHGYFNIQHPDTKALFIGKGPFFQQLRQQLNDNFIAPFHNIQIFSLLLNLNSITNSQILFQTDADLNFWQHPVPLGKFSEYSELLYHLYPQSTYNHLWNSFSPVVPSQPQSSNTSSTITNIIDNIESTIQGLIDNIWSSHTDSST